MYVHSDRSQITALKTIQNMVERCNPMTEISGDEWWQTAAATTNCVRIHLSAKAAILLT